MYRSIFEKFIDETDYPDVFTDGPYVVDWEKARSLLGKDYNTLDDYLYGVYKVKRDEHYSLGDKDLYFSDHVSNDSKTNIIHGVTRGIG